MRKPVAASSSSCRRRRRGRVFKWSARRAHRSDAAAQHAADVAVIGVDHQRKELYGRAWTAEARRKSTIA
jgi:hypothetical protein